MKILEIRPQLIIGAGYTVDVVIEHDYYTPSGSRKDAISTLEISGEKDIIEDLINGDNRIEFFDLIVERAVVMIYQDRANSEINDLVFNMKTGQLFKRRDNIPIIEDRIIYYQDRIKEIEKRLVYSELKLCKYMDIHVGDIVLNKNESKIQATIPVKVCEPFIDTLKISTMFPKFNSELVEDVYKRYLK